MAAAPADTFVQRCCDAVGAAAAAGRRYDAVYVSQTTYLTQQTLVPPATIPAFVRGLRAAAAAAVRSSTSSGTQGPTAAAAHPLVILDAYHGFASLPTDLSQVAGECCYVAGMLKHAGAAAAPSGGSPHARCRRWLLQHARAQVLSGWLACVCLQAAAPTVPL